jgi:hypothetical protein
MACSCASKATAESVLDGAAAVFTGVVEDSVPASPGRSITTFKIVESFKGATVGASLRVLHLSGSPASCGVRFKPGQTYTLTTHRTDSDPGLTTSHCSTWMFEPQVGRSASIIQRLRELRGQQ